MKFSQIPTTILHQLYKEDSDRLIKIKTALFDPNLSEKEKLIFIYIITNAPDKFNQYTINPTRLKNVLGYKIERKPTYYKLLESLVLKGYIDIKEEKIIILV